MNNPSLLLRGQCTPIFSCDFASSDCLTDYLLRARHVEKLKAALLKGLTAEEHKGLALDDALIDAQQVVDSVVTTFREKCAVANAQQNRRNKTDQILEGLEKAAKICDVAIQYSPQATTLVWSGVKLLLQVPSDIYIDQSGLPYPAWTDDQCEFYR